MSIEVRGKLIKLVGDCGVEDAETLHAKLLRAKDDARLDLSECQHLHSAVVQVLLTQPRQLKRGRDDDSWIALWLQPHLDSLAGLPA